MSKSPLGYAEFFSPGTEGGNFMDAAKVQGTQPSAAATNNGLASPQKPAASPQKPAASPQKPAASPQKPAVGAQKPAVGAQKPAAAVPQKGGRRRRRRRKTRGGKRRSRRHTRKAMPDKGWGKLAPRGHARTVMLRNCGKKCFLGPKKSFPICAKGTCRRNRKGIEAAYIRARQWGKPRKSYKSKGKYVTYHGKKGTRRVWMKGSRPRHRRSTYQRVARRARALLRRRR
jgi:hypothetical protein